MAAWCLTNRRFALTDGATDAAFSGLWAAELARQFVASGHSLTAGQPVSQVHDWLVPLQRTWHESIPWDRLPWYVEEKARRGAFATLLGLEIDLPPVTAGSKSCVRDSSVREAGWHAVAVGDSCLFHRRGQQLLTVFPLSDSAAFRNHPYLIGSYPASNRELGTYWRQAEGTCQPGDHFLLATDALAHWLIRESEAARWRFADLLATEDETSFDALIAGFRRTQELRNDDTTLVHVRVGHDFFGDRSAPGMLPVRERSDLLLEPQRHPEPPDP